MATYFKRELLPPKVIGQVKQMMNITDGDFDEFVDTWEEMALGIIKAKIRDLDRLEHKEGILSNLVIDYVVAKGLQGTAFDSQAQIRFNDFYTTLNGLDVSEEELKEETASGVMVFNL